VSTPFDLSAQLYQDGGYTYHDITSYIWLIRRLIYLTTTKPGIAFATRQLNQFMVSPTETHHIIALRILRYLKISSNVVYSFPNPLTYNSFVLVMLIKEGA